jgi:hypothetical protein
VSTTDFTGGFGWRIRAAADHDLRLAVEEVPIVSITLRGR